MTDSFLRVKLVVSLDTQHAAPAFSSAQSSFVFARLFVLDQDLTILAVAVRLGLGNPHHGQDTLGLVEDAVHLLEGPVRCLRVEEIHHREDEGIDDRKNDIGLVTDARKRWSSFA